MCTFAWVRAMTLVDDLEPMKNRVPIDWLAGRMSLARHHQQKGLFQCPHCGEMSARARGDRLGYRCGTEGCGKSGDHITLIRAVTNKSFTDALMVLAEADAALIRKARGEGQGDMFKDP